MRDSCPSIVPERLDRPIAAGWRAFVASHAHGIAVALLLLAVGLTFGGSLRGDFVWDDQGLIVNNPNVQSRAGLSSLLLSSFWKIGTNTQEPSRSFYRPLISFSYAVDHAVWGLRPAGFHLTNLLVHALVCLLVYAFALRLRLSPRLALVAALIFAVHPVHVENVTWISGRTDLFAAAFLLAAILCFDRWARHPAGGWPALWFSTLLYALALAGKEVALCFPLLALLCFFLTERARPASSLRWPLALFAAVTAAYFMLRLAILGAIMGPAQFGTAWERLASIPWVLTRYAGLLLHLQTTNPHHPDPFVTSPADARLWIGLAIVGAGIALWIGWFRQGRRLPLLLLSWVIVSLLPVLKLGTFGDVILADRFLYLPSVGFALGVPLAVAASLRLLANHPPLPLLFRVLLVLVPLGLSLSAQITARRWKNNVTLFQHMASTSPQSAYVRFNLGNAYADQGDGRRAVDAYLAAVRQDPDYAAAYANLGIVLNRQGRFSDALTCLDRARQLGDSSHVLFSALGQAYRRTGELGRAQSAYRESLARFETAAAHNNLGECLLAVSNYPAARHHFDAAHRLDPSPGVCNNIALWHIAQGRHAQALPWLEEALAGKTPPTPSEAFSIDYNLARVLDRLCEHDRAALHARRAIANLPAVKQHPGADAVRLELEAIAAAQHGAHPATNAHTDLKEE